MDQREKTDWVDMSVWDIKRMLCDLFCKLNPEQSQEGRLLIAQWVAQKNRKEIRELIQRLDHV